MDSSPLPPSGYSNELHCSLGNGASSWLLSASRQSGFRAEELEDGILSSKALSGHSALGMVTATATYAERLSDTRSFQKLRGFFKLGVEAEQLHIDSYMVGC